MTDAAQVFHHFIPLRDLPAREGRKAALNATAEDRAAIAEDLGILTLDALRASYVLTPVGKGGWRMAGTVFAAVTQACVVTLDPVAQVIEEAFERVFEPGAKPVTIEDSFDVMIDLDDDDPPEPLGDGIDLSAVVLESLALALDPYPRAPNAVFDGKLVAPPGAAPLDTGAVKPFAALEALKKAMEGGK